MNKIDDNLSLSGWKGVLFFGILFLMSAFSGLAQYKSYKLTDRGDTINIIDSEGRKQGAWLEVFPELRGNPGYEEEGEYLDGQKEGIWRRYSLQGDILAVQSFRWGLLNGKSSYYGLAGLEREEGWYAINPLQKFDTIDVPDLYVEGVYKQVIVPNEGRSLKHGSWTYYNTMTGRIEKSQEYIRDSAVSVLGSMGIATKKGEKLPTDTTKAGKEVPSVVTEWEKKNAGKKKVVIRDGRTGY